MIMVGLNVNKIYIMKKTKYPQQYAEFEKILDEMFKTHVEKNNCYGPGNIKQFGLKGVIVRLNDKMSRLIQLGWEDNEDAKKSADKMNESIDDTLLDMAVYAIIARIYLRDKWGR